MGLSTSLLIPVSLFLHDFPPSIYVSLALFQVFRVVSSPVPDRALDPNVQTCAQVMVLQLHHKVQKMTQRKLAKMLHDYCLFGEGVWMSDMGRQARKAMRIRFGPASVPTPPPPINMADLCVYQGFARLNL